jgi:hypothetical protein
VIKHHTTYLLLLTVFIFSSGIRQAFPQQQKSFKSHNYPYHDQKRYHFGFSLGVNKMDFHLQPISNLHEVEMSPPEISIMDEFDTLKSVLTRAENGFNIGIVSNLKINNQLDLRFIPTLTFGDRNILYRGIKNGQPIARRQQIESTFIDFPLHFRYQTVRMVNTRFYILGGLKYSYDLASIKDKEDFENEILARIGKNDLYYELGAGISYYFLYFKFSTEIKGSFGMGDILKSENTMFTNSIDRLNSRIIMISFLFE